MIAALAYFTVLPLPRRAAGGPLDRAALGWLPVVGAIVGALAGLFGWFVAWRMPAFAGVGAWLAAIVLTGALHVDGFLDCCDALFASAPPQRRLEILRDPHHGTFALVGMVAVAAVWILALDALAPWQLPLAMAFAGCVARLGSLANAYAFRYAREGTPMAAAFAGAPPVFPMAIGIVVAVALGWFLGPATLVLITLAIPFGLVVGWFASRRLGGGITGDVYGAAIVVLEVLVLLRLPEFMRLLPR